MASEKRKHLRIAKQLRLGFHKKHFFFLKGPIQSAEILDVSRGGVRINTRSELREGEYLTLLVPVKTQPHGVEFAARVVWLRPLVRDGVDFTQAGVQFEPLSREQSVLLFRLATASGGLYPPETLSAAGT